MHIHYTTTVTIKSGRPFSSMKNKLKLTEENHGKVKHGIEQETIMYGEWVDLSTHSHRNKWERPRRIYPKKGPNDQSRTVTTAIVERFGRDKAEKEEEWEEIRALNVAFLEQRDKYNAATRPMSTASR